MSESIKMRTTQESSGDFRVYAARGDTPVKGLALNVGIVGRLESQDYIEVDFEASDEGAIALSPDKATTATVRMADYPNVRHAYFDPAFLAQFDSDFTFDGEDTDLETVPAVSITGVRQTSEEEYEESVTASAEEAADALFGEDSDSDEEAEAEADDSDEEEPEEVQVSDEAIGLTE